MTVRTNEYEWSHGKKPRGYGWWYFYNKNGWNYSATGMYGECKKQAMADAKANGIGSIIVSS